MITAPVGPVRDRQTALHFGWYRLKCHTAKRQHASKSDEHVPIPDIRVATRAQFRLYFAAVFPCPTGDVGPNTGGIRAATNLSIASCACVAIAARAFQVGA